MADVNASPPNKQRKKSAKENMQAEASWDGQLDGFAG